MKNKKIILTTIILIFTSVVYPQIITQGVLFAGPKTIISFHDNFEVTTIASFINNGKAYFFKDIYNDGDISYTPELNGKSYFNGNELQTIIGSESTVFKNATFNNSSNQPAFEIVNSIKIDRHADFLTGTLDVASTGSNVTFGINAFVTSISNDSFVDGITRKVGIEQFKFPIGDSNIYRAIEINILENPNYSIVVDAQYFKENSNDIYSHLSKNNVIVDISDTEYWEVKTDTDNPPLSQITVSLNSQITQQSFFNTLYGTQLSILHWNVEIGKWEALNGIYDANSNNITAIGSLRNGIYTIGRISGSVFENNDLEIFNGISANYDGINDFFFIKGIEKYPKNDVEIYNRWGSIVYKTSQYNSNDNVFRGYSNIGTSTNGILPNATYFYIIKFQIENGKTLSKSGYLYLNN